MIGYKIVRVNQDGNRASLNPYFSVIYEPGAETKPIIKKTKLFFFKTWEQAAEFAKTTINFPYEIWKCEAKKATPARLYVLVYKEEFIRYWGLVWSRAKTEILRKTPGLNLKPVGTYWADSITLLERVE